MLVPGSTKGPSMGRPTASSRATASSGPPGVILKLPDIVLSPLGTREDGNADSRKQVADAARSGPGAPSPGAPKDREQQHSADRGHND